MTCAVSGFRAEGQQAIDDAVGRSFLGTLLGDEVLLERCVVLGEVELERLTEILAVAPVERRPEIRPLLQPLHPLQGDDLQLLRRKSAEVGLRLIRQRDVDLVHAAIAGLRATRASPT